MSLIFHEKCQHWHFRSDACPTTKTIDNTKKIDTIRTPSKERVAKGAEG